MCVCVCLFVWLNVFVSIVLVKNSVIWFEWERLGV